MASACYTTFKYNLKQFLTPDGNRVVSLTITQHDSKNTTFLCNKKQNTNKKISMLYSTNVSFLAESVLVQLSKAETFTHSDKNIHSVVFV